ncbi:SusD family outer membrane protein [Mucinivorans hirudinis]|uniref:SusD family outer membrane protein n=1 Tax=Mucinivorans hirudinis TaxID=1433126 RepID=A0A060R801_9BACT|nr:SusD family outer membrane protein [Mucinivorans hirudinis]
MKKIILLIAATVAISLNSCNFLNIVPDDTPTMNEAFKNESTAEAFVYTCYAYIPNYLHCRENFGWLMSNETTASKHWGAQYFAFLQMQNRMYSASSPVLDIWQRCYQGIKQCYIFLNNIEKVKPLIISQADFDAKKKVWIAEAKFLIAYYHFVLMEHYGPVVIVDTEIMLDGSGDDFFRPRKSYDECVTIVADMFDEAMKDLPTTVSRSDYGRATKVIAQTIKSKLYFYAASPLFNGNTYYADFKDKDGKALINQVFDKSKWQKAMNETKIAIQMAEAGGAKLYEYTKETGLSAFDKAVKTARYTMVDPWNQELIWGYSGWKEVKGDGGSYQTHVIPKGFAPRGVYPFGGIGPTLTAVRMFYSKNGLPIESDPAYDYANSMKVKDGDNTLYLHRDREPRFYAAIGFNRGPYELNDQTYELKLCRGEQNGLEMTQTQGNADHLYTGYAVKKGVHPSTQVLSSGTVNLVLYPFPIFRLGELYMNYIEACAEFNGSLDQDATTYFNAIRTKAGLPSLSTSFGNPTGAKLIEVIRRERMIEFAFEGKWMYDLRRWKKATEFYAADRGGMSGLNSLATTLEDYYVERKMPERPIIFDDHQYLYPIAQSYVNINYNLIQNPGW